MRSLPWTPALAGLLLVAGVQTIEASQTGDPVQEIRDSFKAAKRGKSLTVEQSLTWVDQLFALAETGAGTDQGFEALSAVMEIARSAKSPELTDAAEFVPGMMIEGWSNDFDKMGTLLSRGSVDATLIGELRARTTNDRVKAASYVTELGWAMEEASRGPMSDQSIALGTAAVKMLDGPLGELEDGRGKTFRSSIEGNAYQLQNLRIGMVAPDIVAKDFDGVEFKLSDYRGKVVVLDFWGNW